MARANPAHSGYTIQHGVGTGSNGNRIDVWVEYFIGAYNIAENTTPFTAYFYAALNPSYSSNTSHQNGLNSTFSVDGAVVSTITAGAYDFRSSNTLNLLGSYSGNIAHNNDGTRSITISGSFTTASSYITGGYVSEFTINLPTIPRKSNIDSASDVTLGNNCVVRFTPKAASMWYRVEFNLNDWTASSEIFCPNTTSQYTYTGINIPLDVARQFQESSCPMEVVLYTYSDSAGQNQIGADDAYFDAIVPDNSYTKPAVNMSVAPGTTPISGLYIQGLSTVQVTLSATDHYGADISSKGVAIGGTSYEEPYTSGYLNAIGNVAVTGYATNSRGFTGTKKSSIEVIQYSRPKIQNVSVVRCTADGTPSDSGTYLKISATRSYSKVMSGGTQRNHCEIHYCYKAESDEGMSDWDTILATDASADTVTTEPLLGNLSAEKVYMVWVQAIDTLGYTGDATISLPSASVFMHRRAGGKAMGLGKYVEADNLLDVAWNVKVRGNLALPSLDIQPNDDWPGFRIFRATNPQVSGEMRFGANDQYLFFDVYNNGIRENFSLPKYTQGRTEDGWFEILTTKKAVPVANGGTGAWDAASARANLGVAPAGYGLGEEPVYLENANTAKNNGWYWFDENTANTPLDVNYGTILVKRRNYLEIIQEVVDVFGTRVQRTRRNGTWDEWEFENPPMLPGVEYRTTERRNGYSVFKKLVRYNHGATIEAGDATVEVAISHGCTGMDEHWVERASAGSYTLPFTSLTESTRFVFHSDHIKLLVNNSGWGSSYNFDFVLAYTKTTN